MARKNLDKGGKGAGKARERMEGLREGEVGDGCVRASRLPPNQVERPHTLATS